MTRILATGRRPRIWGAALIALSLTSGSVFAQQIEVPSPSERISSGTGAMLRGLDKMAGTTVDLRLGVGDSAEVGPLVVMLEDCRYPVDNPAGEAFAWIDIYDSRQDRMIFAGWMIASSPALNALDHARFDLWVLNCTTS